MIAGPESDIGSLLDWGKKHLRKNGIEDYDTSAEALLEKITGLSRSELLINPGRSVTHEKMEEYRNLVRRRAQHVPLQYLLGYVEFYNVRIKCDSRALIPRPETEILVDVVLKKIQGMKSPRILDIGTGSGNIAIALARNSINAYVVGVDISIDALNLALENAIANEVQDRISLIAGDILDEKFVANLGAFDCVVSNPPYVAEFEKEKLQPEVIEFEPEIALFSPGDPLRFFRAITEAAPRILKTSGLIAFEIGLGQASEIKRIMTLGFEKLAFLKDLSGIDRVITGNLKSRYLS